MACRPIQRICSNSRIDLPPWNVPISRVRIWDTQGGQVKGGLPYIVALEALDDHRGSVCQHNIGNLVTLILREPLWNREAAAKLIAPGVE